MARKTAVPPATPDRIAAIANAADTLEILATLSWLATQSSKPMPDVAEWLAAMTYAHIEEIRSAIQ